MELSEFVAGQVLDYVEKREGFIPTKNLTELGDILHSSISQWESKEIAELREKLAAACDERDRLRTFIGVELRDWLDMKIPPLATIVDGAIAMIDEALAQPAGEPDNSVVMESAQPPTPAQDHE